MDYLPVDSLSEKVEMLEHLSESCDSGDVRHIRSHYWRARLLSRAGYKDSALMLITTSMAMIDSVRYTIIGKTKSAILKNEKYIFWCFPAISGASV